MEIFGIIYKTTNLINGKIYIGQTRRWKSDTYLGSGTFILKAINKYGKQNFIRETLKVCYNQNQLDAWEFVFIKRFNSTDENIGYNILSGTANEFGAGSPSTIEGVKKRISKSLTGKLVGSKNPNYGNYWTIEQKINLSRKLKGRKMSDDFRQKMSEINKIKGRFVGSDNPLAKNGWRHTDEERKKIGESVKVTLQNPEVKKKISENSKKWWSTVTEEWRTEHFKKISSMKHKRIIVFTLDLKYLRVFESVKDAQKAIGKGSVSANIRGVTTNCSGYVCKIYDKKLLISLIIRKKNKDAIKHRSYKNGKIIFEEDI